MAMVTPTSSRNIWRCLVNLTHFIISICVLIHTDFVIPQSVHLSLLCLHDLLVLLLGDPLRLWRQQLVQDVCHDKFWQNLKDPRSPAVTLCVSISIISSDSSTTMAVSSIVTLAALLAMLLSLRSSYLRVIYKIALHFCPQSACYCVNSLSVVFSPSRCIIAECDLVSGSGSDSGSGPWSLPTRCWQHHSAQTGETLQGPGGQNTKS